jgi:hypothetical protein
MTGHTDRMRFWATAAIPRAALILGMAGLIPFGVLGVVTRFGPSLGLDRLVSITALNGLIVYATCILSFMGGAQWGLAMTRPDASWRAYGVAVMPALIAAFLHLAGAIGVLGPNAVLVGFAVTFTALFAYDVWTINRGEAPAWYAPIRLGLTIVVVACLMLAATR